MIGATDGRGVPQNLDAERSVLGALLLHADAVKDVLPILLPADFLLPRHQIIYRAILAARDATEETDTIVVGRELERHGRLQDAGGTSYLIDLADSVVSAVGIKHHAEIVREKSRQRRLMGVCNDIARRAYDNQLESKDLLVELHRRLTDLDATATEEPHRMRSWLDVATDPPVVCLVDGLVPRGGLDVLGGEPGAGKTQLALDLALRCAHGMPWFGRACRPASTLYLAGEGSGGLGARLRAWRAAHPEARAVDGHYVAIVDGVPNLTSPGAARELDDLLAAAQRDHGRAVDVVVIDTLAMAAPGADENDAGAVGLVLAVLADLRRRHGCAIVVLHHTRKPQPGAPSRADQHALRGSSALAGAADVVMIAGADGDAHALRVVKVRDGEVPTPMRYRIASQDTGMARADGRPEHGPVVLPATAAGASAPDPAATDAADVDRVVGALRELGTATRVDTIVRAAGMRLADGRAAVDRAMASGRIARTGPDRRSVYRVGGTPTCATHPPHPADVGTSDVVPPRRPGDDVQDVAGRQPDVGTFEREHPAEPDPDDGLPEQPQGRRQFRAVGR